MAWLGERASGPSLGDSAVEHGHGCPAQIADSGASGLGRVGSLMDRDRCADLRFCSQVSIEAPRPRALHRNRLELRCRQPATHHPASAGPRVGGMTSVPRLSRRMLSVSLTVFTLFAAGAIATILVTRNLYFPGLPYAEGALLWSLPEPSDKSGQYIGMLRYTADELNRTHPGAQWGPITYVPADVPSTRPNMVSVNPIDDYTWSAAAYSVRTSRCYLILSAVNRADPRLGDTFYGELPPGVACVGTAATPTTATERTEPPE